MLTANRVPQEPRLASAGTLLASALVSPVAVNTNVWKPEPGRNWRFSGRSNGVAPAAFASALASNGEVPFLAVLWTVIHCAGQDVPSVCSRRRSWEKTSPEGLAAWNLTACPWIFTWSAWSFPPFDRLEGSLGTNRNMNEFGCLATSGADGSDGSTRRPVTPSSTASRAPATLPATVGTPAAAASR